MSRISDKIEAELRRRFAASISRDKAITITMKADGTVLIIIPAWLGEYGDIDNALFSVYVDFAEGRVAIPYLASRSIEELSSNIEYYSGVDTMTEEEKMAHCMSLIDDFIIEYDVYTRHQIESMEYEHHKEYMAKWEADTRMVQEAARQGIQLRR